MTSLNSPTSLMRRFYDNVDVSIFNQNYSVILSQNSLCGPAPAAAQGQVLYGNGVSVPCDLTVAQNYAIQGGVKAVYYAIFFCELFMLATDTQYALPPTVPFFASLGNPNPLNTPWPGVLSEPSLLIPAFAAKGANISIFLSSPQTNTLLQAFYDYNSPFQWVYAVNFTACCVLIVMASMKLRLFISHAGFVVQLPLLVLTSALCAGIIGVFQSQLGFFGWRSVIVQRNVYKFFEFWVFGFALQVSVMMGLYFKEVASLTSNSTIVGLGKMTVVAVPVLGFMWAFILITGSFNAAAQGNNISSPLMITMLSLFTVTAFVVVALTCWGSFSILRSIGGLDKRKWNLILTVVLSLLSMCLSIALGMVYGKAAQSIKMFTSICLICFFF